MGRALCFVALVMAFTSISVSAQVNSWINPGSGNWDDPSSWSLGVLPGNSQSVMITNSGWKAVAINPSTPVNFPDSMTVSNLTILGASNTVNTLLLNYVGAAVPLTVSNGLTLADGGQILNFNSALVVQGGTVIVTNSQMIQDGGLVCTTNAPMYLSGSDYGLINGVFEGGVVGIGAPVSSQFNQYGGAATIATLDLGARSSGSSGTYALYGGNLNLPGGLSLLGENGSMASYFQSGGTNQTTRVMIEPGLFGISPTFKLNGGLLADNGVSILGDDFGSATLEQNGGTHIVSNGVRVSGGAHTIGAPHPATYQLNGGTLSALSMDLDATSGDAALIQSNGIAQVAEIQAHSGGSQGYFATAVDLSGGTLSCSNLFVTDGGSIQQDGGALTVSNTLSVVGYLQTPGPKIYSQYQLIGGTLIASNINMGGYWVIGDSTTNRISNPGTCSLSYTLQINNAVEQLGRFILAGNATINLAGNASRLSFANSSGETWAGGATLVIADWNGNPSGGGAEQLTFGTDQSGLTPAQLSQIQFSVSSNLYPAKILATGEVVPDQGSSSTSEPVNSWINPGSGNWDDPSSWSLGVLPDSSQSVIITNSSSKTVAINSSTPTNFPGSMTVSNLTIRGAPNTVNTLLLNYAGTAEPLTVSNGLTLADGGQILNFNSALVVQGGTVIVTNSQMIQDGGFVQTTNAPMYLSGSEYDLTNGVFEGGVVWVGRPVSSQFNQYGGTATIATLDFGAQSSGSSGAYALYAGNLNLPGGLRLLGANSQQVSYFQAGGTNQTTQVMIEPDIFGASPSFKLNGGLLADNDVSILGDDFGSATIEQNGGTHIVSNGVRVSGGAHTIGAPHPATYQLNGGTLSALSMDLDATSGDAALIQSNGIAQVAEIQAHGDGAYWVTAVDLSGGTLSCSNLFITDGGSIQQYGGALTVSNTLSVVGYRNPGRPIYSQNQFLGGTLVASNIIIGDNWIIGDSGGTNRISNPGTCSLSYTLQIGNAVEQLGRFILASNATINLAGSASRLSFANSSGETWAGGATLVILNWNGNPSGGGAEQLTFGTDQSGLTPAQLSQIQFSVSSNLYPATILATGEVVPDPVMPPGVAFSQQGNNLVLTWPPGWSLQTATNFPGPFFDIPDATPPFTIDMTLEPQQFFRLRP